MDHGMHERLHRSGRLEVWLFLAMLVAGLLGFMSTLTEGDYPGGEEFGAPARVQQLSGDQ